MAAGTLGTSTWAREDICVLGTWFPLLKSGGDDDTLPTSWGCLRWQEGMSAGFSALLTSGPWKYKWIHLPFPSPEAQKADKWLPFLLFLLSSSFQAFNFSVWFFSSGMEPAYLRILPRRRGLGCKRNFRCNVALQWDLSAIFVQELDEHGLSGFFKILHVPLFLDFDFEWDIPDRYIQLTMVTNPVRSQCFCFYLLNFRS